MRPGEGDLVRITGTLMWGGSRPGEADPSSPPVGSEGIVTWVNTWTDVLTEQYSVKWDNGVHGPPNLLGSDPVEIVERWGYTPSCPCDRCEDERKEKGMTCIYGVGPRPATERVHRGFGR